MSPAKITVVVPLYNKYATVERSIDSVLLQKYPAEELIVVDDGSTDGSAELIKERYPHVRLINQPNAGVSAARNVGVSHAHTEFVAFLDADDWWDEQVLMKFSELIENYSNAALFTVSHFRVDGARRVRISGGLNDDRCLKSADFIRLYASHSGVLNSSSVCLRRPALHSVGGFPEAYDNGEDVYVWLRLGLQFDIAASPEALVYIDRPSDQFGGQKKRKTLPAYVGLLAELEHCAHHDDHTTRALRRFVRSRGLKQMLACVANEQRPLAISIGGKLSEIGKWFNWVAWLMFLLPAGLIRAGYRMKQDIRARI